MKRAIQAVLSALLVLAPGALSPLAMAEEGGHPKRHESVERREEKEVAEDTDLPGVIFNHVANESELEFANPLTGDKARFELPRFEQAFGIPWLDLSITKHLVWMWVAAIILIAVLALGRPKTMTPKGGAVLLEMLVLFVRDEIAKPTIGEHDYKRFTPYLLTCFFFILFMNLVGIIPFTSAATGNLAVTAGLAICTFMVTQYAAIKAAGIGGYLKHLTGGVPPYLWVIMIPVEVLGLFTKPFALCVRLFANMVAGHIVIFFLLGLIFILNTIWVAPVSVAFAGGIYLLELFVALVQAYVFTILSSLFIGMAVATGHHDDHGDGHHDHHADHPQVAA